MASVAAYEAAKVPVVCKDLTKVYKERCCRSKVVVNNVSFLVQRGQVFGLLGTNGAGKTTLFKILAGQIHQSYG